MKGLEHSLEFVYRFLGLLLLYTLLRLGFYGFNSALFPAISGSEWVVIFLQGIRFDITTLLYINLPFLILALIPFAFRRNRTYQQILKSIFVLSNMLGVIIALSDFAYYPFNSKRMDSELVGLLGTLPKMAGSFISDYWYLVLLGIAAFIYLIFLFNFTRKPADNRHSYLLNSLSFVVILGLSVIGFRGGFQKKPIRPVMASSLVRVDLAPLVTNSPYTFFYSLIHRKLQKKSYFDENQLDQIYPIKKTSQTIQFADSIVKPNIVYLILESFSSEYMGFLNDGQGFTPCLDSLSENMRIYTHAFANGRRSSQALVALSSGIPALMDDPYMYSPYLDNKIYGLPKLLKRKGYHSSFFNGSKKEMLGWYSFIGHVGFDEYFSRESYPIDEHDDGHWGIYDHYYLDYFIEKLRNTQEPFFSSFFTISSHHPYHIPPHLQEKFSGSGDFVNALKYSDWAIGEFFKKASKEPWFENTIFILTADHTNGADWIALDDANNLASRNRVGIYSIPILMYSPKYIKAERIDKPIQQIDLFDTCLDLAGYDEEFYSFGHSVYSDETGISVEYANGIYQLIDGNYILLFKEDIPTALYHYADDPTLKINLFDSEKSRVEQMANKLKAIIQQHNRVLVENSMKLEM